MSSKVSQSARQSYTVFRLLFYVKCKFLIIIIIAKHLTLYCNRLWLSVGATSWSWERLQWQPLICFMGLPGLGRQSNFDCVWCVRRHNTYTHTHSLTHSQVSDSWRFQQSNGTLLFVWGGLFYAAFSSCTNIWLCISFGSSVKPLQLSIRVSNAFNTELLLCFCFIFCLGI